MFKCLVCVFALVLSSSAVEQSPKMIELGEALLETDFSDGSALTKENFQTRKETHKEFTDGKLSFIPPKIAYKGNPPEKSKWAASSFSRMAFINVIPQDYCFSFSFQIHAPQDEKDKKRTSFFFEFGHRYVRLEMNPEGTKLLIMNRLSEEYIILDEQKDVQLLPGKEYAVFAEIKGEEVLVQLNDKTFYGKHELIKKTRPASLQVNNNGAGFDIDYVKIWQAGAFKKEWSETQKQFSKK